MQRRAMSADSELTRDKRNIYSVYRGSVPKKFSDDAPRIRLDSFEAPVLSST